MSKPVQLVFLTVPPPRSQSVVDFLADLPNVTEAAAVYTETDVIARVSCEKQDLDDTLAMVLKIASSAKVNNAQQVDSVLTGDSVQRGRFQGHSSIFAFIRCTVDTHSTNFKYAVARLQRIREVRYAYPIAEDSEVVLQVVAPDKISLDEIIMEKVQDSAGIVQCTRTFVTINDMHWSDDGAPRTREQYRGKITLYPVFMAVAEQDHKTFAVPLVQQIRKDTQIDIWHYGRVKEGRSWAAQIDEAMRAAECYLPLISEHFLKSEECKREYAKIEGLAGEGATCSLVLPGCSIKSLEYPYDQPQLIDGNDLFGYSKLLNWLRDTV